MPWSHRLANALQPKCCDWLCNIFLVGDHSVITRRRLGSNVCDWSVTGRRPVGGCFVIITSRVRVVCDRSATGRRVVAGGSRLSPISRRGVADHWQSNWHQSPTSRRPVTDQSATYLRQVCKGPRLAVDWPPSRIWLPNCYEHKLLIGNQSATDRRPLCDQRKNSHFDR